jgi:hypothetical protein
MTLRFRRAGGERQEYGVRSGMCFPARVEAVPCKFSAVQVAMMDGIKRDGPPQAVQKLREGLYMVQVPLSETPSADWKRLFYETQQFPSPDFLPRAVDISGHLLRFRTDAESVETKTAWIDRWIARANQKEAGMGGKTDEDRRRRREEHLREQQELAAINTRWQKL